MKEIVYQVTIDQDGNQHWFLDGKLLGIQPTAQPKFEYQWDRERARETRRFLSEGVTQIKAAKSLQ